MLNTDTGLTAKHDDLRLVKRAREIWAAQGGTFTQAFAQAEAEQRQQPAAQRPMSTGVALSHGQRQKIESINLIGNVRLT
jgi:hypothetical protein